MHKSFYSNSPFKEISAISRYSSTAVPPPLPSVASVLHLLPVERWTRLCSSRSISSLSSYSFSFHCILRCRSGSGTSRKTRLPLSSCWQGENNEGQMLAKSRNKLQSHPDLAKSKRAYTPRDSKRFLQHAPLSAVATACLVTLSPAFGNTKLEARNPRIKI